MTKGLASTSLLGVTFSHPERGADFAFEHLLSETVQQ